jgi:C-terminal processing protease CtpA/Prc
VHLTRGEKGFGLAIETQDNPEPDDLPKLTSIQAESPAARTGNLFVGDLILEVNGVPMAGAGQSVLMDALNKRPEAELVVIQHAVQQEGACNRRCLPPPPPAPLVGERRRVGKSVSTG